MKKHLNNINASSLFHFTRKFNTLQSIIKNGLRFSFAFERFSARAISNLDYPTNPDVVINTYTKEDVGVAIPMISFCDIPLTRTTEHIYKYGEYVIGFDKDFIIEKFSEIINPVIYIHSKNLKDAFDDISNIYSESHNSLCKQIIDYPDKGRLQKNNDELKKLTSRYIDRKFFIQFVIGLMKPYGDNNVCFYNEREWRAFIPNGMDYESEWKFGITKEDYDLNRNDWNIELSDANYYLTFEKELLTKGITHIVVRNESQIIKMIEIIMKSKKVFGNIDLSETERLVLTSKITSFERIKNDY